MGLEDLRGVYFGDELLGQIVRQIIEMGPGVKLPSERDQASELGASRTALRDRLSSLESIGVLERRVGVGTFTKGLRPEAVRESLILGMVSSGINVASLRPVRVALERQAVVEAARYSDYETNAGMFAALKAMEASDNTEALHSADVAFHKALFRASGSAGLIFFSEVMGGSLDPKTRLVVSRDKEMMRHVHRNIADAIAAHDVLRAVHSIEEHFSWLDSISPKPKEEVGHHVNSENEFAA